MTKQNFPLHLVLLVTLMTGCSIPAGQQQNNPDLKFVNDTQHCSESWCNQVGSIVTNPEQVTQESLETNMATGISKWFYGKGLGTTTLNIGTAFAFPPYALYLLGNAGLQLAGFSPLYITDALPETPRTGVLTVYDTITATPGHITSAIAGAEYYDGRNSSPTQTEN